MKNIAKEPVEIDSRKFYIGLAIALGLHLLLISLPIALWLDVALFKSWSVELARQGLANFYTVVNSDYPPGYLYVLWLLAKIYQLFDPTFSHTDGVLLMALIKLPSVLADIGSALVIAQILKLYTTRDRAYRAALIYAFNPLMIFVSAIWGQVDGVIVLLMLCAFYLIQQNQVIRAGILIAAMLVVKPQGIFFAPFLVLSQWFRQAWWKWGAIALGGATTIWLIIFPFFGVDRFDSNNLSNLSLNSFLYFIYKPFLSLYYLLQGTANFYSFGSVNAFNIWIWSNWQSDYATFLGISYRVIGLGLLGILMMWLTIFLYHQRHFSAHCVAIVTMLVGFFVLPTRMHERYMLYSLAFFAITIAIIPLFKWLYWAFTFTGSINVGYVYLNYNHGELFNMIPEILRYSITYITSVLNVILLAGLLIYSIRLQILLGNNISVKNMAVKNEL